MRFTNTVKSIASFSANSKPNKLLIASTTAGGGVSNIEIKELIVDLRSQVVDYKNHLIDFQEQIVLLKQENSKLKEKIATLENNTDKVIFKNGAYFKNDENRVYCSCCYETKKKLITLNLLEAEFNNNVGNMICPNCHNPAQVE